MKTDLKKTIAGIAFPLLAVLACGAARAQVVLDGSINRDVQVIRWVQTVPTAAGDNAQASMPGFGNPGSVTTGIELKVPMTALGSPANNTSIRIGGLIVSPDYTLSSNQVIGSLLCDAPALGASRDVRFDQLSNPTDNKQYVTVGAGQSVAPPVIDGTLDAAYGAPVFLQAASTDWGDSIDGQLDYASASEIDGVYVVRTLTDLYVFVAGNLATDASHLMLFFDSKPGAGQNTIRGDNGYYALNILGDDGSFNGMRFDFELYADYCLDFSGVDPDGAGASPAEFSVMYAEMLNDGGGRAYDCGSNTGGAVVGGTLSGGQGNAPAIRATLNNTNAIGVNTQRCDSVPDRDLAIGSEIDNVAIGVDAGKLFIFVGGNLKTDGTVLNLFIDHGNGDGQNVLRADNPPGTNNMLGKMAGLRFDPEFSADDWVAIRTVKVGDDYELWADAAVLRSTGPRTNSGGFPLDYSAYCAGVKNGVTPIWFDGPRIDAQTGSVPALYTQFAPSAAGESCLIDPLNPVGVPGLIGLALDNSNVDGVEAWPNGATSGAPYVTTGVEIVMDLAELGWDGAGPLRIAGFLADPTNTTMSNQVLGGVASNVSSLGPIAGVDFATIANQQFIFTGCLADFNRDGFVNGDDYDLFAEAFDSADPSGDMNMDGFVNGDDYDVFAEAFDAGC
ncbi:MAG: hypothetical protein IT434_01525 [Phycisphaerales bacterium]|jgi:hypothetical protein|nr:hypothetical protein [Phycisphaerales bacterium]